MGRFVGWLWDFYSLRTKCCLLFFLINYKLWGALNCQSLKILLTFQWKKWFVLEIQLQEGSIVILHGSLSLSPSSISCHKYIVQTSVSPLLIVPCDNSQFILYQENLKNLRVFPHCDRLIQYFTVLLSCRWWWCFYYWSCYSPIKEIRLNSRENKCLKHFMANWWSKSCSLSFLSSTDIFFIYAPTLPSSSPAYPPFVDLIHNCIQTL